MSLEATLLSLIENQNIQVQGELSISQNIYAAQFHLLPERSFKILCKLKASILVPGQRLQVDQGCSSCHLPCLDQIKRIVSIQEMGKNLAWVCTFTKTDEVTGTGSSQS